MSKSTIHCFHTHTYIHNTHNLNSNEAQTFFRNFGTPNHTVTCKIKVKKKTIRNLTAQQKSRELTLICKLAYSVQIEKNIKKKFLICLGAVFLSLIQHQVHRIRRPLSERFKIAPSMWYSCHTSVNLWV